MCPPGESLENMLILQDTINDERSRREATQGAGPAPISTQNNHESPGCSQPGCSQQPSIIPNPASSSSVTVYNFLLTEKGVALRFL